MLGVEAVLLQTDALGVDRPIAHFFKKLILIPTVIFHHQKGGPIVDLAHGVQSSHFSSHSYSFQITKHSKSQGVLHLLK